MTNQRTQSSLYLIQELLRCPEPSQSNVLDSHSALIDSHLLELIQQMISTYSKQGDGATVSSLGKLADLVEKRLEVLKQKASSSPNSEKKTRKEVVNNSNHDEAEFLSNFLPQILQGNGDLNSLLPNLLKNMDPASSRQIKESLIRSGGSSEGFVNLMMQSNFLGEESNEALKVLKDFAGTNSKRDPKKSQEANLVSGLKDLLDLADRQGKSQQTEPIKAQLQTLSDLLGVDSPYGKNTRPLATNSQTELLLLALKTIIENKESGGSYEQIYEKLLPLLKANVDKLNNTFPNAIRDWGKALGKGTPENSEMMAAGIFLFGEAIEKFQLGSPKDNIEIAIACYEASVVAFDKKRVPMLWAIAQASIGKAFLNRINGDKAENIEKSITSSQLGLQTYPLPQAHKEWARTQINLSNAYRIRIRGDKSSNIEMAIAAAQSALESSNQQTYPEDWATAQQTLAAAYSDLISGDHRMNIERAIYSYEKALTVYTRERNPKRWAGIKNNLSHAYRNRAYRNQTQNLEDAIDAAEEALSVQTKADTPVDWATIQTTLGSAYTARIKGDRIDNLNSAIKAYRCALEVYTPEADPRMWALAQANLAIVYFTQARQSNQYREENLNLAIAACESALRIYTRQDFPERWIATCTTLANIYNMRLEEGQTSNVERSVAIYTEALEVGTKDRFPDSYALIHLNMANAQQQLKSEASLKAAIASCQSALAVYTQKDNPSLWAMTQNNLGIVYQELNETAAAMQAFREALKVNTPETDPINCLKHGRNLGRAGIETEQWLVAIEGFEVAIDAIEKSRGWTAFDLRKQEILSDAISAYFGIVEAYVKNNQLKKALEHVERSKAQNLVELLANRDHQPKGNIPEPVSQQLKQLKRDIVSELRRLEVAEESARLVQLQQEQSEPTPVNRDRLSHLQQQLEDLITHEIDHIDPSFRATQQVQPISYNEILSLVDEKTTILEWYITSDTFYTFAVNAQWEEPKVWSSQHSGQNDFQRLTAVFKNYLQTYQNDRDQWKEALPTELENLSELLHIEDICGALPEECDRLILIPHRFLHLVPLHALPIHRQDSDSPDYLLDLFTSGTSYAPSCQFLHLSQTLKRPEFENAVTVQNPANHLKPLNYIELSTSTMPKVFSPEKTQILEGVKATKDNLYSTSLDSCHSLFFGCHGYFNLSQSRKSALILADDTSKKTHSEPDEAFKIDERTTVNTNQCLTLDDIFGLDLSQCRLVTLSACETGLIEFQNVSDEYIGLPSGFMYAGSTNVVSSLWGISEVSTALIIARFYEELSNQSSISFALNRAQKWLREATREQIWQWIDAYGISLNEVLEYDLERHLYSARYPFQSPYYWAAFCATGQ